MLARHEGHLHRKPGRGLGGLGHRPASSALERVEFHRPVDSIGYGHPAHWPGFAGGTEKYMNSRFLTIVLVALGTTFAASAQPSDKAGCADHPLFPTRMPGYRIAVCELKPFGTFGFWALKGPRIDVEGRSIFLRYQSPDAKRAALALEVVRNYENAITKAGGTILAVRATGPDMFVNGKVTSGGREAWVQVRPKGDFIELNIIEKQEMEQHVVADAAAFGKDLRATGHVAVYGIFFDTGKAELKSESTPALEEVKKLLSVDPALRLWVVGHTDSVGKVDDNMRLSQARAEAVVRALTTTYGVAAARLKGYGVGPLAPVASNEAEEGRAKNRRVELVQQ